MRFFPKTVAFFISVILLQSTLTILLVTSITRRSNWEDAVKEVKQEATAIVANYHSWKRGIWKNLIAVQQDRSLLELLRRSRQTTFAANALTAYFREHLPGADICVLKYSIETDLDLLPITYHNFSATEVHTLENTKTHPYLELRMIGSQLCLIGIIRLTWESDATTQNGAYVDVFSIKRLDLEFCQQLSVNRNARVAFLLNQTYLSGTLDETTVHALPGLADLAGASADMLVNADMQKTGYNTVVQNLENLVIDDIPHTLYVMTAVSNAAYISRIIILERTVVYVSVFSGLLTILLSLFLSRNITQPIKNLIAGMQRIRDGEYDTTLDIQAQHEIGALVQDFNAMANKIHQDKVALETYIHEITLLKDYNEKILHSIGAGLIILNPLAMVEKVNNSFLEYFELQETDIVGQPIQTALPEIFDADILASVHAIFQKRPQHETKMKRAGRNRVYELNFYPIETSESESPAHPAVVGCVCIIEDISKKVAFEEKIFQVEKLSSISMLSAGIAHEINNPLGSIMTNVQNLIEEEIDAEKNVALRWIEQETRRIARIVRELLDFSSSDRDHTHGADVNTVITDILALLKHSLRKQQQIRMSTALEEGLPFISMSQDELKQIILNLVKNSMQAITNDGDIHLTTSYAAEKQAVCVTVADTGSGIQAEHLPRIFDPFYTTKPNGEGTGLGLSVVYGLINKYHGTINVTSEVGKGTQIHMLLPVRH